MKILNWNIRGMNAYRKQQILVDSLKENKVDMVAIQETKKESFSDRTLRNLSSHVDSWVWLPSRGRSGGILFGCASALISIINCYTQQYTLTMILQDKTSLEKWMYTIVYAPIDRNLKEEFWSELKIARDYTSLPWLVSGDFNAIRYRTEKSGLPFVCRLSREFNSFIQNADLNEFSLPDRKYTWTNGRHFALLDRFFCTNSFVDIFPHSEVSSVSSYGSDHCPLLLNTTANAALVPPLFRFESTWLKEPDFVQLIIKWWIDSPLSPQGDVAYQWKQKLSSLTRKIRGWAKNHYGAKRKQKQQFLSSLHSLEHIKESRALSPDELSLWTHTKNALDQIYLEEEIHWKQRSKQKWLAEGDYNTKFFHLVASHRKKKK